ncbi:PAP2 superfamily protein [Actinacidiphila yanglinensis]|uniref:PAP2 superfamily protein n=1 Tax=Actinacidiphila yanglinensis TaxID=310779 RepID=A0A1H6D1W0_9ACTN|nr:phosphatase PAP2 family protein [Actinacidiphila yanglinensis]SEG79321.1 PAP2 superfamily protein [Actinacidiphila yanglinensis]
MTITATAPRAAAYRGRLRWWTELPLIAVVYALHSGARLLVRGDVSGAVQHGADILHFEQIVHLDPEHWFNRLFTDHAFLGVPADFAYASLHYIVTPSVLVWLWRRRPTHYRVARTWLMLSTLIGLIGFTLVPTAPPRLLTGHHGFIDTMAQYGSYGWWGTDASAPRGMGDLTNQYAAMPSLHVGWSLWCGIMLFRYGRHWTVRTIGVLYPLVTAFVVMGTANHYLMDAAAGVLVMGVGFLLAKPALRMVDALYARYGVGHRAESAAAALEVTAVDAPATDRPAPEPERAGTAGTTSAKTSAKTAAPSVPEARRAPGEARRAPVPDPRGEDSPAGAREDAGPAAGRTADTGSGAVLPGGEPAARS